ncbi:hypothetical protein CG747_32725 [Streptomyces sp. CB02959]|uniref:IS3 family transposase n=1 Tax=Streptomyces sp. CB02959 TaxID=2020330 RepID=UPI000C27DCBB|nr:hypothetical protein CG747_32725 [Streptomyces sp. CB02959]
MIPSGEGPLTLRHPGRVLPLAGGLGDLRRRRRQPGPHQAGVRAGQPRGRSRNARPSRGPGFQHTLAKLTTCQRCRRIEVSTGPVGNSCKDALAENLWMLIKTACVYGRTFTTQSEANLALFEYIDGFHNPRRVQGNGLASSAPSSSSRSTTPRNRRPSKRT